MQVTSRAGSSRHICTLSEKNRWRDREWHGRFKARLLHKCHLDITRLLSKLKELPSIKDGCQNEAVPTDKEILPDPGLHYHPSVPMDLARHLSGNRSRSICGARHVSAHSARRRLPTEL